MSCWIRNDAARVIRRAQHAITTGHGLDPEQNSYMRGQVAYLLIGPLADELPDRYADCLRDVLRVLEGLEAGELGAGA
jgi:hypothetical protein